MKAWMFDAVGQPLRRADVDRPKAEAGQLVVQVRAAGLCHSDVGAMAGLVPVMTELPMILGHEVAGTVVEVGPGVDGFTIGDRVASAGDVMNCPGISRDGAYAEYVIFDAARTVPLPDSLDWAQAAAATDAGVTSYVGVMETGCLEPGQTVVIIGLGGLGLVAARIASLKGATVIGVEPKREAWEMAKEAGVSEIVADVTELAGREADLAVDYAGFGATTAGAVNTVRPGGRVVLVGLGAPEFTISSPGFVLRNITLCGATPTGDPRILREVFALMADQGLTIATSTITFDDIPDGLQRLADGQVNGRLVAMFD